MTLREAILKAVGDNGIEALRLYYVLRYESRESLDGIIASLLRAGRLTRTGTMLRRRSTAPVVGTCRGCDEPKRAAQILDNGLCLQCASQATLAVEEEKRMASAAGRRCPDCQRVLPHQAFTMKGSVCQRCKSLSNDRERQRRRGVGSWQKNQTKSQPAGASCSRSSSPSVSGRSSHAP